MNRRRLAILALSSFWLGRVHAAKKEPNAVSNKSDALALLAMDYKKGVDVGQYWVSEKFDGVRALWDGSSLRFRSGRPIAAPAWFTAKLPTQPLDGELWMGRRKFDALSAAVRRTEPKDEEWRALQYLVFELPSKAGSASAMDFTARAQQLKALVQSTAWPQLVAVEQSRMADDKALKERLNQVVKTGGEGLMLHRADAPYLTGRNAALLKLKPVSDAEGVVLAHIPGKGKYAGLLGALEIRTDDGLRLKIGTGFTDAVRENPPAVGSTITYSFRDKTFTGKPRFASFLRASEGQ
jgi:DNA ligase 1